MKKVFKLLIGILGLFIIAPIFIINCCVSEHNEFINSTFLERRQHISTDGPYIISDKENNYRVIEVDRNFKIKDYFTSERKFDVNVYSFHPSVSGNFTVELKDSIKVPQSKYDLNSDILVISDIEGNWFSFSKLLQNGKVMDENFNWIFGKGHLVLLGDFMDRGLNVTQILWLIYKLEDEAAKQGGKVHFILGNHEIMNLVGMTYHVRSKYKKLSKKLKVDYSNYLYGDNSELGKWLRSKNTIERIGDYLFVHGGISPRMYKKQLNMDTINERVRNYNKITDEEEKDELRFGNNSPLWYRGYTRDREDNIKEYIDSILVYYHVKKIIVGHTCRSNIEYSVNDKVIDVDVHFPQDSKDEHIGQCLLITNGDFWVIDTQNNKVSLK